MKTAIINGQLTQINDSVTVNDIGANEIIALIRKVQFEYAGLAIEGKDLDPTARAKIRQASTLIKNAERGYIARFKNTDKVTKQRQQEEKEFERKQAANRGGVGALGKLVQAGGFGLSDASADKIKPLVRNTQRLLTELEKATKGFFAIFGKDKIRRIISEVDKALNLLRQAQAIEAKIR